MMREIDLPAGTPDAMVEYLRLLRIRAWRLDQSDYPTPRAFNLAAYGGARGGGKHPRATAPRCWQRDPYAHSALTRSSGMFSLPGIDEAPLTPRILASPRAGANDEVHSKMNSEKIDITSQTVNGTNAQRPTIDEVIDWVRTS